MLVLQQHITKDDYMLLHTVDMDRQLGKGVNVNDMMAEILGRATGTNHGKGGSMHICDFDNGILGANGIVGGNGPIACGADSVLRCRIFRIVYVLLFRRRCFLTKEHS